MDCRDKEDDRNHRTYFVIYLILGVLVLLLIDALVLSWRL